MKELREQWMQMLSNACQGDYSRVLFLDETGAMTNLVRTYGRSAQGERCIGAAPAGDLQQLLPARLVEHGLAAAVGVRRRVPSFLTVLLPHPPDTGQAGVELLSDVFGIQALMVKGDDLASFPS